jgi:hypothetical protein
VSELALQCDLWRQRLGAISCRGVRAVPPADLNFPLRLARRSCHRTTKVPPNRASPESRHDLGTHRAPP